MQVNWVTASYRGYNTSGVDYNQATTVAGDTIFSQSENTHDEAGNVLSVASFERLNDASASDTGALSYGSDPKARVSYSATWYDGIDRLFATAAYGAIASFTRPTTPPRAANWSGTSDAYAWVVRFQGVQLDKGTGLYYFRNRDYLPTLGRWIRRDPSTHMFFINLYAFSLNPIGEVDPLGLTVVPPIRPSTQPTTHLKNQQRGPREHERTDQRADQPMRMACLSRKSDWEILLVVVA